MTLEDQVRDEKLPYDIDREAAKISALGAGKTAKYKYLTGEEILPSNQQQLIEQAKFTYSPLGKAFDNGYMSLEDIEKEQIELKMDLGRIKQEDPRDKSEEQKKTIDNSREEVVKTFNDYARNMSRNIYDSKQEGTRLKILTPKQMLQRLPISLAQIKADNNSQSLLNEIRQIVYSLYQSKEITKKVYDNILKSIKA